jgi:hypothetical protein
MRKFPIAAVAAVALMAGTASAQVTPPSSTTRTPTPGATTAPAPAAKPAPAVNPLAQEDVSRIDGTGVYGSDDSKIGHISTVLMNPGSKQIDRMVISSGGVLGVGSHRVAMPVDKFTWDGDKGVFRLQTTVADLKGQPEWVEGPQTATGSSTAPISSPSSEAGK